MATIVIKSQEDFDNLPKEFKVKTVIRNESNNEIKVKENQINSEFHNVGKSRSLNYGHSHSINYDNSTSVNNDNSTSVNNDNSSSKNHNKSRSINYNNSRSINYNNSRSINYDNSSSKNYSNSSSSNYNNSSSINYGNSSSINFDNSISENNSYSSSESHEQSVTHCYSKSSTIIAYDNSTIYCHDLPKNLEAEKSVNIVNAIIKPSFEQWLKRGIVCADGIKQRFVSQKNIGEVTVYTTKDFNNNTFYVARNDNKFAHAKTVEEAIKDLRYKISDRDTSKYDSWKLEDVKTLDELVEAYRAITGACEEGTKLFCEGKTLKNEMTIREAIDTTKGNYGGGDFLHFFNK